MSPGVSASAGPGSTCTVTLAGATWLAWPAGHPMVTALGAASVTDASRDAAAAGVTALMLATVSDFAVLRPDPVTEVARLPGLRSR